MYKAKVLFGSLVIVAVMCSTIAAIVTLSSGNQYVEPEHTDAQVVLGHRVGPNGQEMLVYAN
ncbi:hypothetical protein D3C81_313250 [compost metagenome]